MPPTDKEKLLAINVHEIRNADKRKTIYNKQKDLLSEQKKEERKRKKREYVLLGEEAPVRKAPKTIDNQAEVNHTVVSAEDEEVMNEEEMDEFSKYFKKEVIPKMVITSCLRPTKRCFEFIKNLLFVFPGSVYYPRRNFPVHEIVKQAKDHGFTDLMIVNEDHKKINGMTVVHLPEGPTAYFKLSNVKLNSEIEGAGSINAITKPEVILNRFTSRVGKRCARILGALFHQEPHFKGRRVVTFHNQRDFVFFRQHRYIFERAGDAPAANDEEAKKMEQQAKLDLKRKKLNKDGTIYKEMKGKTMQLYEGESIINKSKVKVRIQEIGPQFTMKLKYIQHGTFDKKHGEYEWKHNNDMKTHKTKFHM